MVDSEDFPLDPNITTDCFWDAVNEIEKNYSSSASTATIQNHSSRSAKKKGHGLKPTSTNPIHPLSNVTNNSHTIPKNKTPKAPIIRARTNSSSSTSSTSSNGSGKKRKFKCPKPVNSNTTYYKDYVKYKPPKSKSPPNPPPNMNTNHPQSTFNRKRSVRARNPLNLSQTSQKTVPTHTNNKRPNNDIKSHSFDALHSDTKPSQCSASSSSYRSNAFSASCTAESISRLNISNVSEASTTTTTHDADGFAIPRPRPKSNKISTKTQDNVSQMTQQTQDDMRVKLIAVKKDMARLRREKRQKEQRLEADVELHKRRANDLQSEAFKWKAKAKQCQNANHEKYTKQFQTLRCQITELRGQREAEEREKVEYCAKNKELMMQVCKQSNYKSKYEKMSTEYKKLYQNLNEKKRKLDDIKNEIPTKKMKLMPLNEIIDEDMMDVTVIYASSSGRKHDFNDKPSMIQYEMQRITELLMDQMSGDPLDDLGLFIQSLSINNHNQRLCINEERQKWQKLLNQNWFLSKQTKSLVPLIRFLFGILSRNDFNHILPMTSAIRILQIVFDGRNGKLYRDMLLPKNAKKNAKKKKKKNGLAAMIARHGMNHLFIIEKDDEEDVQMAEVEASKTKAKGVLPNIPADYQSIVMNTCCGTPHYVAPEVIGGRPYNDKCDMWSLGVIVFVMLAGYQPFYAETVREIYAKVEEAKYDFNCTRWHGVSNHAKHLVKCLLNIDSVKRYSAEDVKCHKWIEQYV
eukprot:87904_1